MEGGGGHTDPSFEEGLGKLWIVHEQFSETGFGSRIEGYRIGRLYRRVMRDGLGGRGGDSGFGVAHDLQRLGER